MESQGCEMPLLVNLGLCQLNQWALDFEGNLQRIIKSIQKVKEMGAYYRLGPELEISGYACDDHFFEYDTINLSWNSICALLQSDLTDNCLVDVGMPLCFRSVRYNCRLFLLNRKIVLIRPKMFMANEGSYRETRYFGSWRQDEPLQDFVLPKRLQIITGERTCPFGFAGVQCNDCVISSETCEELFVPLSPHINMALSGVDIFTNGSASYFETGKFERRMNLINAPLRKMGGIYLYSNMKGNDGGRSFFDGSSFISCNGTVINTMDKMSLEEVQVMVETVNITEVRSYRAAMPNFNKQASNLRNFKTVAADIWLSGRQSYAQMPSVPRQPIVRTKSAQVADSCSVWLWDYLRRSGAQGFFVPLSGGADSGCVVALVYHLCKMISTEMETEKTNHSDTIRSELAKVLRMPKDSPEFPNTQQQICFQILHTAYLGTRNSSAQTRDRARRIAEAIGSYHVDCNLDELIDSAVFSAAKVFNRRPRYQRCNGSSHEDLALQNVQARSRLMFAYLLASLIPTHRASDRLAKPLPLDSDVSLTPSSARSRFLSVSPYETMDAPTAAKVGYLINLSTGNADECIRGYFTKYDCSSADINPLGSMSKILVKEVLRWAAEDLKCPVFDEVLQANPTAELTPLDEQGESEQSDEAEMGLTYPELHLFGDLRKTDRCGPIELFEKLVTLYRSKDTSRPVPDIDAAPEANETFSCEEIAIDQFLNTSGLNLEMIAQKVKHFFRSYAQNRHKSTTLPPSFHAEAYDPDDNRFDWRPFLYPEWKCQFQSIDEILHQIKKVDPQASS